MPDYVKRIIADEDNDNFKYFKKVLADEDADAAPAAACFIAMKKILQKLRGDSGKSGESSSGEPGKKMQKSQLVMNRCSR